MVELTWQGDVAVVTMTDGENRFDAEAVVGKGGARGRAQLVLSA